MKDKAREKDKEKEREIVGEADEGRRLESPEDPRCVIYRERDPLKGAVLSPQWTP